MENTIHPPITRVQRIIKLSLQVIILLGLVISAFRMDWFNVLTILSIMALSITPTLFAKHYHLILPTEFELVTILFIFASMFLGEIFDFYERFWWWDLFLHGTSGVLLGVVGLLLVWILNHNARIDLVLDRKFMCIFAFSFSVSFGALWEIFEFTVDNLFNGNMQRGSLHDTMWDLIVDSSGAMFMSLAAYLYYKTGRKSQLVQSVQNFLKLNTKFFQRNRFGKLQED